MTQPAQQRAAYRRGIAQSLVDDAKSVCPYSKATKGNIAVICNLI